MDTVNSIANMVGWVWLVCVVGGLLILGGYSVVGKLRQRRADRAEDRSAERLRDVLRKRVPR